MGDGQARPDPNVLSALRVLKDYLEGAAGDDGDAWPIGQLPALPVLEPGEKLTATDLLGWWFRPPRRGGRDWDSFFSHGPAPSRTQSRGATPGDPGPGPGQAFQAPPPAMSLRTLPRSWTFTRSFLDEDEVKLVDEHAEAAVECLYEFLHALERREVDVAMDFVALDYHTMENDRETRREDLRARVETMLESLQGWDIEVSLTTAPEPLFHPVGVLILADIQVNAWRASRKKRTHADRRVAIVQQQGDGRWKIAAFSPTEGLG